MLKSLIKIRLQGIFMRSMKGSKKQKITAGKIVLMLFILAYIALIFGTMFGYMLR